MKDKRKPRSNRVASDDGLDDLREAINSAPPLPACEHGQSLCDWGGERTAPPCGCTIEGQSQEVRRAWARIKLGLPSNAIELTGTRLRVSERGTSDVE